MGKSSCSLRIVSRIEICCFPINYRYQAEGRFAGVRRRRNNSNGCGQAEIANKVVDLNLMLVKQAQSDSNARMKPVVAMMLRTAMNQFGSDL